MYRHLLVPIDGTPLASATVEQAVAFASASGASLTFLHVRPDLGASGEGALLRAISPDALASAAAGNARAILGRAEASARAAQVSAASLLVASDHVHEAILEAARTAGCDLVFMATHGRRGIRGALLGSVTRRVLEGAGLPVLVAAVESNLPAPSSEQRALALLRGEHRSLAAVLQALIAQLDNGAREPDVELLRAMMFYIEQFPERLHHPKEEQLLFSRLREHTNEFESLLSELEEQHRAGAAQFAVLREQLDAGDLGAFTGAVHEFVKQQWKHMSAEESLVLPAASRHFTASDWQRIAEALDANGDPRFGTGESFDMLAARLLELAGRR